MRLVLAIAAAWAILDIFAAKVVTSLIGSIAAPLWEVTAQALAHS